jgi:hypothetical protein
MKYECEHCGKESIGLLEQGKTLGDKHILLICSDCAMKWSKFLDDELRRRGYPSYHDICLEKFANKLWLEIRELWHSRKPKVKVMLV